MPDAETDASVLEALEQAAETLEADLRSIFGHEDAAARMLEGPPARLEVSGSGGRFTVRWPPSEGFTRAEGELGAHARIAFEFLLASASPGDFFEDYRPQSETRREIVFDALEAYIDDSLRENPYYTPLHTVRRGPVMLVYGDDEYALVAEDGHHKGHGILRWKVQRLVAYALTDADDELF